MALTVKVDTTVTPNTLTVVSDRRVLTVTSAGDTATFDWPIKITPAGTWLPVSDDGVTAVFHA